MNAKKPRRQEMQKSEEGKTRTWTSWLLGFLAILLFAPISKSAPIIKDGDVIAICGDSITEQKQYSVFIEDYLTMCQPNTVRTMQFGWGGETSWGFLARMDFDVLPYKPTLATTCYGMNDGGYAPLSSERGQRYLEAMEDIVERFKSTGARVLVGSPGVVDSDTFRRNDPGLSKMYNENLAQLRDIDREIATRDGCAFADVHSTMMDAMVKAKAEFGGAYHVAGGDGVHPQANGHLVMAYAFLKSMGFDGDIGTITIDLGNGTATASDGHTIDSATAGEVTVTSKRYPFCFFGEAKDPAATRGMIRFIPFNHDLNRLTLKVENAGGEMYRVTWGATTREFTGRQLSEGINLAAEFLDNPFSQQFTEVEKAIRLKQTFETQAFKNVMPVLREAMPEDKETVAKVVAGIDAKHREKSAAIRELVKPVTHTIKIEQVK